MRRWAKRAAAIALLLLAAAAGYGAWRFGHPALPAGSEVLASGPAKPGSVTVRSFGATTLAFDDGRSTVMVDALLTRPGMRQVLFGTIATDRAQVDATLRRAGLAHVDLLLVSHSHYDHALDVGEVARRTGATVVGSASTRQVALGNGVAPDRIVTVGGGERLQAGDFTVTVFRSRHSAGDRVPGTIDAPLLQPAKAADYREGGTFAYLIAHKGLRILVHASANVVPAMYHGVRADVVFLATGGLSGQPEATTARYWDEVVRTTGARLVVPIHWDDFLQPLASPLQPLRRSLDDIPLTMRRLAPLAARDGVAIRYLPVVAPVDLAHAAQRKD